MPRFVILQHDTPPGYERPAHWDLMLEVGTVLRTWSLPRPLEEQSASTQDVDSLVDHRLDFLTFEGPLTGDRGSVTQWDAGTYTIESGKLVPGDVDTGNGSTSPRQPLVVRLCGGKLTGKVELTPVEADTDAAPSQRWRLVWSPEESAD